MLRLCATFQKFGLNVLFSTFDSLTKLEERFMLNFIFLLLLQHFFCQELVLCTQIHVKVKFSDIQATNYLLLL